MALACPRCGCPSSAPAGPETSELVQCGACHAEFAVQPTVLDCEDGCQCVVWRDGERRCELWRSNGESRLRMYDGDELERDELFIRGGGWDQAIALRRLARFTRLP